MSGPDGAPVVVPALLPAAPTARAQLTDRGAVALAGSAWLAAWWYRPVPVVVIVGVVVVAAVVRRPLAVGAAVAIAAAGLSARSHAGLRPVVAGPYQQIVTLVTDPVPTAFGWRADVRVDGRRVELSASAGAGGALSRSLAGERVRVEGRLAPPRPNSPWLVPRHVVGRLDATSVERAGEGTVLWRGANRFRRLLQAGSDGMGEQERSLYRGFVLGDDRNQMPEIVDDFRGSGLTHLLVVSGQNVAFVLVLVSPFTSRLTWRGRWLVTLAVIGAFGAVTRFEPSVLRASAMAAVAVTAGALGRPSGSVRNLALAVTALVLVDPLLVHSVGFQLSVGASLAIALWARRIADSIPGPRVLAEAVGVTMAAQFGVAPVLVPFAGGLPVVSLLTNPLAVPVAGLVTTWGLPAGVVAGIGGPSVATVVHAPTAVLVSWVAAVARVGASLPLGSLGWPHLAALAAATVIGTRSWSLRWVAAPIVVVALLAPAWSLRSPPIEVQPAAGLSVYRAGGATVVVADPGLQPRTVLEGLRTVGVRRVDLLVVDGRSAGDIDRGVRHRWTVERTIELSTAAPARFQLGGLVVAIAPPAPPEVQALGP